MGVAFALSAIGLSMTAILRNDKAMSILNWVPLEFRVVHFRSPALIDAKNSKVQSPPQVRFLISSENQWQQMDAGVRQHP
jgi:hypothetical protein